MQSDLIFASPNNNRCPLQAFCACARSPICTTQKLLDCNEKPLHYLAHSRQVSKLYSKPQTRKLQVYVMFYVVVVVAGVAAKIELHCLLHGSNPIFFANNTQISRPARLMAMHARSVCSSNEQLSGLYDDDLAAERAHAQ